MGRIVYLNGEYVREEDAKVSIFDRGFLMADAVYEVTAVLNGKLIDFDAHIARLHRSMDELDMPFQQVTEGLRDIHLRLIRENNVTDGLVYLQITRGNPQDRDFPFPDAATTPPTVVLFTQNKPGLAHHPLARQGTRVISMPDLRWARRDIKTVQLLYPSLCKMAAKKAGANDAWMILDGFVTEGTSNNAWIVRGRTVITRPTSQDILHGITRAAITQLAEQNGMDVEERTFTLDEAKTADEAFSTSAAAFVMPVVQIDDVSIGDGTPGPMTRRLREIYLEMAGVVSS